MVLIACLITAHTCAQVSPARKKRPAPQPGATEGRPVPAALKEKFRVTYPDAVSANWQPEGDCYKVSFIDKNIPQVVVYDTTGKVTRKETALDGTDAAAPAIPSAPKKKKRPSR